MADIYIKQRVENIKYSNGQYLEEMSQADLDKVINLFAGDVEVFEDTGTSVGSLTDPSANLNEQAYTVGKKRRGTFKRSSIFFRDVIQGKTINDFEAIKDNFHCHKDIDQPPTYLNLLKDEIHANKLI